MALNPPLHPSRRLWSLWLFAAAAASACGPGLPSDPVPHAECVADSDCDAAASVCQSPACVKGECVLQPAPSGVACDDGRFCTVDEVCDGRGNCGAGSPLCHEYAPGIPRCNEALRQCEICTDGRALVNGECRCPYWNCLARGGATFCSETDQSEINQVGCYYDGLTVDDLPPLESRRASVAR